MTLSLPPNAQINSFKQKKTSPHKDVIKAKKNGMVPGAFKVKTE